MWDVPNANEQKLLFLQMSKGKCKWAKAIVFAIALGSSHVRSTFGLGLMLFKIKRLLLAFPWSIRGFNLINMGDITFLGGKCYGIHCTLIDRREAFKTFCFFFACRTRRVVQAFLLLLVSPPMILFLLSLAYNTLTSDIDADFASILVSTLTTVHQAVTSSIREARMLGTWSFALTCLGVLPNWLMFWCLAWYWSVGQSILEHFLVLNN